MDTLEVIIFGLFFLQYRVCTSIFTFLEQIREIF